MLMWMIIMYTALALTGASLVYLSERVSKFSIVNSFTGVGRNRRIAIGAVIVFFLFGLIGLSINFVNAVVCSIYFAMCWLLSDLVFFIIAKIRKKEFKRYYAGMVAIVLALSALGTGWYLDHNVWITEYNLSTTKDIDNLKILMFADAHLGTTFDAYGFEKHIDTMQQQDPDVVVVSGDFVDDSTTRDDMIAASRALGRLKTRYGVYFVFGNHDKGYYGAAHRGFSGAELIAELEKNGVVVLRDDTVRLDNKFYIIGRRDFSEVRENNVNRKTMRELVAGLDEDKYMIVADHQPTDYDNQANSGVDLVLSGHTHGGQLFPFNQVGKWIGANDLVYGFETRNNTNFIVTSGISDWAIKFKTGTKSEVVVINLNKE